MIEEMDCEIPALLGFSNLLFNGTGQRNTYYISVALVVMAEKCLVCPQATSAGLF